MYSLSKLSFTVRRWNVVFYFEVEQSPLHLFATERGHHYFPGASNDASNENDLDSLVNHVDGFQVSIICHCLYFTEKLHGGIQVLSIVNTAQPF